MIGEKTKQAVEVVVSHPKAATAIAGIANANVWFADYEPVLKFATSILGIVLVLLLIVKHTIDIAKSLSSPIHSDHANQESQESPYSAEKKTQQNQR